MDTFDIITYLYNTVQCSQYCLISLHFILCMMLNSYNTVQES